MPNKRDGLSILIDALWMWLAIATIAAILAWITIWLLQQYIASGRTHKDVWGYSFYVLIVGVPALYAVTCAVFYPLLYPLLFTESSPPKKSYNNRTRLRSALGVWIISTVPAVALVWSIVWLLRGYIASNGFITDFGNLFIVLAFTCFAVFPVVSLAVAATVNLFVDLELHNSVQKQSHAFEIELDRGRNEGDAEGDGDD